ncbi:histidine phosphatase family protein [Bacteroidota bacterium]
MKTIFLVRHAKSSWQNPDLNDDERPLLKKGENRTKLISKYLKENKIVPELLISSHAVRAYETAKIIAKSINYPENKIRIDKRLYEKGIKGYYNVIDDLQDEVSSIMLFGHNPTITSFANHFVENIFDYIPTSGIVSFSFETDKWEEINKVKSSTNFFITPKQLKINK